MSTNKGYEDLLVWQKAINLADEIYVITKTFPKGETYGLVSQMRRCAVSIASNIAEGYARNSYGEFGQFLGVATGSVAELHTQLIIATRQAYLTSEQLNELVLNIREIGRMLGGLKSSLKPPQLVTGNR